MICACECKLVDILVLLGLEHMFGTQLCVIISHRQPERANGQQCMCVCVCEREREIYIKQKGNLIPVEAWTGPECSRRLKLPDLKTFVK
jgi:hypothetical protein